jgi:hypothetical protein
MASSAITDASFYVQYPARAAVLQDSALNQGFSLFYPTPSSEIELGLPNTLYIFVDASFSMRNYWDLVCQTVESLLVRLDASVTQFSLIAFNDDASLLARSSWSRSAVTSAMTRLRSVTPNGPSIITRAFSKFVKDFPCYSVVVTDGKIQGPYKLAQMVQFVIGIGRINSGGLNAMTSKSGTYVFR